MKKLLSILALSLILFVGCSDNSINSPEVQQDQVSWISTAGASMDKLTDSYVEKRINGNRGGIVTFNLGVLMIPAGAFNGSKLITVSNDTQTATVDFGPSMEFDKSVYISIAYSGLDLSGVDPDNVKFVYLASDGTPVECPNDYLYVNVDRGILMVVNARADHFSRYGFIR